MSSSNIGLGQQGEKEAVNYLKNDGYSIIDTNYRTRLGQIDIVAKDKKTICFIEVKARRSAGFGLAVDKVLISKQRKISAVALAFLKKNKLLNYPARFDVISISYFDTPPKIKLIKNAFELDSRYLY